MVMGGCVLQGIYQECAQVLYDEIDYINEGRNADR
jgi:predicted unusual protein kinase regulating ubiquinone biosynthesis (AarF/ABC1/UbiB family)